jgi:hypothetical protein
MKLARLRPSVFSRQHCRPCHARLRERWALWDSLEPPPESPELLAELERRSAEAEANPAEGRARVWFALGAVFLIGGFRLRRRQSSADAPPP